MQVYVLLLQVSNSRCNSIARVTSPCFVLVHTFFVDDLSGGETRSALVIMYVLIRMYFIQVVVTEIG